MVPHRKVTDEQEARALLAEVEAHGLTAGQWARRHGVDGRSMNAWRINLARREAPRPTLQLVELLPTAETVAPQPLTVRCGPFSVEVPADFDEQALAHLLGGVMHSQVRQTGGLPQGVPTGSPKGRRV